MRITVEAKRLLPEKGYDATSISDITEASGIRRASFCTYFASKQDVLLAIGRDAEKAGIVAAGTSHIDQLTGRPAGHLKTRSVNLTGANPAHRCWRRTQPVAHFVQYATEPNTRLLLCRACRSRM
jgi:AcrR family transcriptional regulator